MTKIPHYYVLNLALTVGMGQVTKHCTSLWLDLGQDQAKEQIELQQTSPQVCRQDPRCE